MKKKMRILAIIIMIALCLSGVYILVSKEEYSTALAIMIDITDRDSTRMTATDILSAVLTEKERNGALDITIVAISDIRHNPAFHVFLPKESVILGNKYLRQKQFASICQRIDSALTVLYSMQSSKATSWIYLPLINMAHDLDAKTFSRNIIILQSNLQENTSHWSCFSHKDLKLLRDNPALAEKQMLCGHKNKPIHHVEIRCLYKPVSQQDDEQFSIMSDFFQSRLNTQNIDFDIVEHL